MSQYVKALIAVKSTERRDALVALLESLNQIDAINKTGDEQTVRDVLAASCPALILADFDLFDAVRDNCGKDLIVLVVNRAEQAEAYAKGATQVFIEGTPVSELVAIIEQCLRESK